MQLNYANKIHCRYNESLRSICDTDNSDHQLLQQAIHKSESCMLTIHTTNSKAQDLIANNDIEFKMEQRLNGELRKHKRRLRKKSSAGVKLPSIHQQSTKQPLSELLAKNKKTSSKATSVKKEKLKLPPLIKK